MNALQEQGFWCSVVTHQLTMQLRDWSLHFAHYSVLKGCTIRSVILGMATHGPDSRLCQMKWNL